MNFYARFVAGFIGALALLPGLRGVAVAAESQAGRTWFVDAASGVDTADGRSAESAWKNLSRALKELQAGDKLVASPGRYHVVASSLVFRNLPRVTFVSRVPGQAVLDADWRESARKDVAWRAEGDGLFSAECDLTATDVTCAFTGEDYLHNYRYLAALRAGLNRTEGYHKGGEYFAGPESGVAFTDQRVFVRLTGRVSPEGKAITLVRRGTVVKIEDSPGFVLDGFVIRGRSEGVSVSEDSPGTVVRNCVFLGTTTGVSYNADHGLVEWCEMTLPGLTRFNEELMQRGSLIYYFMKDRGLEGGLIDSHRAPPAARFMEARYNYVHDVFDGDHLGSFDDSSIHHTVYGNCFDNAVEFEPNRTGKAAANLRFHHNWLEGLYRGALSHQQNGLTLQDATMRDCRMEGPHQVDHNVVILRGGEAAGGWEIWNAIKSRPWNAQVQIHYSHNLFFAQAAAALFWLRPDWQAGIGQMRWENNILLFPAGISNETVPFPAKANLLVAPQNLPALVGASGAWFEKVEAFGFVDLPARDFRFKSEGIPAQKAGQVVPTAGVADGGNYFGPFEPQHPSLRDWPRPHRTAFAPEPLASGGQ